MLKSPYYKVWVGKDRDVTDLVTSFRFEDCLKEDDMLYLTFRDKDVNFINSIGIKAGMQLRFIWGFLGGLNSGVRTAEVKNVNRKYGATVDFTVTALAGSHSMKKNTATKVWKNKNLMDIVKTVATKYGLTVEAKGITSIPMSKEVTQGAMTDFDFLKKQFSTQPGYLFYVKDDKVVVTTYDMQNKGTSKLTWDYGKANSFESFEVNESETSKTGASDETTTVGFDPKKMKTVVGNTSAETNKSDPSLSNSTFVFKANDGAKLAQRNQTASKGQVPAEAGKHIPSPITSTADAQNKSNAVRKSKEAGNVTATLTSEGMPGLLAGAVMTVAGVGTADIGNWLVEKHTHNVGTAYRSVLELARSGTKTGTDVKNTAVNKTVGAKDAKTTKEVKTKYVFGSEKGDRKK